MLFLNLPIEIISQSLSYITDVNDIVNLSKVNSNMNDILKLSINILTTEKDLIIFDARWLVDFPLLSSVSDNIVFQITNPSMFKIPYQLKKFNVYTEKFDINILNLVINNLHHHVSQYTIRLISDLTIIIDQNMYQIYGENAADEILTNLGLNAYNDNMITELMYPNKMFRNFIDDLDLFIWVFELLPGYDQYGYILLSDDRNLLFEILKDYTSNGRAGEGEDDEFIYAYADALLEKYASHFSLTIDSKDKIIKIPRTGLHFGENDLIKQLIINYAHFYLRKPSIYDLCLADWYKF